MKTLKFLSLLLIVFSLAFCVIGCSDKDDEDDCDHDWSDWELVKDGYCHERKWERECEECGETKTKKGRDRDHEQAPKMTYDENYHWYPCKNCDYKIQQEAHVLNNGECINCSYSVELIKPEPEPDPNNPLAGVYNITMWVSELESYDYSVVEQMESQIKDFMAANPGIIINATISGVTEADAGSQAFRDIDCAPDIYCFAQDMLAPLAQAGALAAPGGTIANDIRANNDGGSILAATFEGTLYAYPMTSDNGYYLYYDKSVITDPTSLEAIIADCESAYYNGNNNYLFRYALENGWYNASFFFGAGCHSEWIMDQDGNFIGVNDNFNSEQGLVAMKGMQKLTKSIIYNSDADQFRNTAAIVTGIWYASIAEDYFGDNLGVCKLPSYTVDGKTYQLGSFSGNRLMGVKPQTDSKKAAVLQLLAHYLTSEKCQMERYDMWQWAPSNLEAQSSEEVQSNVHFAALAAQNAHAVPQGQINGGWWDLAAALGSCANNATTDKELLEYLNEYELGINAIIAMTSEQKEAWSVIGNVNGTCWDTDFPMIQISEGVWESEPLYFSAGSEFKLRRGASWDVNVGADGQMKTPYVDPPNIVVETTGSYIIRLEWDGVSDTAKITLFPI